MYIPSIMLFNRYYSSLLSIFMEELPPSHQIPLEIVNIILYKFGGIINNPIMVCMQEFSSSCHSHIINGRKHNCNEYSNPKFEFPVKDLFITYNLYNKSRDVSNLILKRIFEARKQNNMDTSIFNIKFNNKLETTHFFIKTINRKLKICDTRRMYLLSSSIRTGHQCSLISKLLINNRLTYVFSDTYLEKQISNELNLNYDNIRRKNLHRYDLINIYLTYTDTY